MKSRQLLGACAAGVVVAWIATPASAAVSYTTVARTVTNIPGTTDQIYASFGAPSINDSGVVTMVGQIGGANITETNKWGLFGGTPGNARILVRGGQAAPGSSGSNFLRPYSAAMNNAGQIVMEASLEPGSGDVNPGVNDFGVWRLSPNVATANPTIEPVVRHGQAVPNGNGKTFAYRYNYLGIADNGQVGFWAGTNPADTEAGGVFAGTPGGAVTTIAVHGMPVPGNSSTTFWSFDGPTINANGHVAFDGRYSNFRTALWAGAPGAPTKVAEWGQPSVVAGSNWGQVFNSAALSSGGRVVFQGYLEGGGGTSASGIFTGPIGGVRALARTGDDAPGIAGAKFAFQLSTDPVISADNYLLFSGSLTGPGVTSANDSAIWIGHADDDLADFKLIAREGDAAPGLSGAFFGEFLNQSFSWVDDGGVGAFRTRLTGPSISTSNDQSIWSFDTSGALLKLVREGDVIPVAGVNRSVLTIGTTFSRGSDDGLATSLRNGRFAFSADVAGGYEAIMIANIPEPGGASAMLLVGALAAAARRRRRG